VLGTSFNSGVHLLKLNRQVPLFTSGGHGLGLGLVILVLDLRIWSCLHHWSSVTCCSVVPPQSSLGGGSPSPSAEEYPAPYCVLVIDIVHASNWGELGNYNIIVTMPRAQMHMTIRNYGGHRN